MNELKERMLGQSMNEYGCDTKIYLKSEADKVIAHHKYKRCLAMAMWCDDAARLATWDADYHRCGWYNKWRKRWLAIAEKFKPNSTAQ